MQRVTTYNAAMHAGRRTVLESAVTMQTRLHIPIQYAIQHAHYADTLARAPP